MYKWIKEIPIEEKNYSKMPNRIPLYWLEWKLDDFLKSKVINDDLKKTLWYFKKLWYFWSPEVADEVLRNTNNDIVSLFRSNILPSQIGIDYFDYVSRKLFTEQTGIQKPNKINLSDQDSLKELQKIMQLYSDFIQQSWIPQDTIKLQETIKNKQILAYQNTNHYDFQNIYMFWVPIKIATSTMLPKLTTWALINQVFEYLEWRELSHYQVIDIGTWETNFIPKVLKYYKKSLDVIWFDVNMLVDNDSKRIKWKFWNWESIKPYVNKKKDLIITANLPYSPEEDIQHFDQLVQAESKETNHRSFKGWWKDGLDLYKQYIDDITEDKENISKIKFLVFEALEKNIWTLEQYVKEKISAAQTSLHKNYKWENRILRIEL